MTEGVRFTGIPSAEELRGASGIPSQERMKKGPVAVIECVQEIPCNPCENACPFGAIKIGDPITNCPFWMGKSAPDAGLASPCAPDRPFSW